MKVIEAAKIKGNIHDSITSIRIDRKLTGKERACRMAIIGDITLSAWPTSVEDMIWTWDEVQDPKMLIGQDIILR